MLPFLKKQSPDDVDPSRSSWHPDFRNAKRLPDTKVIRTSFLLNSVFVLIALVPAALLAHKIYLWRDLGGQISQWQTQIDRDKGPSDQAIALYKKFQGEAARSTEVATFVRSRPVVSDLLIHLGKVLPDYIALDRFDLSAATLNIRGAIRGAPDQASGRASTYLQQLKSDPFFAERFSEVTLVNLNRNPKGGLSVDLAFKLKDAKKS